MANARWTVKVESVIWITRSDETGERSLVFHDLLRRLPTMALIGRPRRQPLPEDAARVLGIEPQERVLAWSRLTAGRGYAVATREGLRILTPRGALIRRPWTEVRHAAWDPQSGALAISWVGSRQTTPLEIDDPSRLPDVVHQRVSESVLLATEVVVPGGRRVWVALRRSHDGTLSTQAVPPVGLDLQSPAVASAIRRAVQALRDEAGMDEATSGASV